MTAQFTAHLATAHVTAGHLVTAMGLGDLLAHPFMRYAFLAGLPIAALAGIVGYFMVLRSQVFTGDALSHVAFTGALGALAFGVDARLGLFTATGWRHLRPHPGRPGPPLRGTTTVAVRTGGRGDDRHLPRRRRGRE